ncbi:MAG TPA: helix-hairpin-helix domain-containing protein, partial [Gemmatimonadaceae bacterium]
QVKRAGEVIPQVIAPLPERREDPPPPPTEAPTHCPACGTPVERDEEEVAIYCPNVACPGRQLEGLVHFAARDAMDVRGLSYARIQQLLDAHLLHSPADLYDLRLEQLLELDRFAEKSAQNLIDAIAASRQQPLSRLLFGLGIRHVGAMAAQLLAREFGSLAALRQVATVPPLPARATEEARAAHAGAERAALERIGGVRGIGEIIARSVVAYFSDPSAHPLLDELTRHEVALTEPRAAEAGDALKGCTVVITGTLPTLSRTAATELVERAGGRVTSSVSRNTSFVVAGEEAGGKLEKARTLGIQVIDEAGLLRRVAGEPPPSA